MSHESDDGAGHQAGADGHADTADRAVTGDPEKSPRGNRLARSLHSTVPLVLAGSMAMTLTGPITPVQATTPKPERSAPTPLANGLREAVATASATPASDVATASEGSLAVASVPSEYTVVAGDTVSSIAGRFGMPTASVLALNGLSWRTVIYPGQVLALSAPTPAPEPVVEPAPAPAPSGSAYTVVAGDTVGAIAARFGVPTAAVLEANGLSATTVIYVGETLTIPGASAPASVAVAPLPPSPSTPPPAGPVRIGSTSHVIQSGETISSVASLYGVGIQSILDANGLGWSSIIYSGQTLTIPSVEVVGPADAGVTPLTPDMRQNATTIISVGRSVGANDRALVIALSAAMQESSLLNLDRGDLDSLGLFQQRPSSGWGSPSQLTDPVYASRLFFGGPSAPNRGITRGLLDIPGWEGMSVTQAAQAVQLSGYPDAYAKWETSATSWVRELG